MRPLRDEQVVRGAKPDDGLAAYRRLVELQKQMVELVKRNEQSKQACVLLREQIEKETAALCARPHWQRQLKDIRRNLVRQLSQASSLFKRLYRSNGTISNGRPSEP